MLHACVIAPPIERPTLAGSRCFGRTLVQGVDADVIRDVMLVDGNWFLNPSPFRLEMRLNMRDVLGTLIHKCRNTVAEVFRGIEGVIDLRSMIA